MNDLRLDAVAVGAHPDDIELVVAGTLLKLRALGYATGILDMTRGEMGTRGTAEIRAEEAAQSAAILSVAVRENLELPDSRVWCNDESRTRMVRFIRTYRPKILFTHYWDDPHPDHAHISQVVRESAYLAGLAKFDAQSGQERFRPAAVAHFMFPRTVAPSFVVDISEFAEKKMQAIKCFSSQLHDPKSKEPPTRISSESFLRRVEARQRFYGTLINAEHGEAFVVREALHIEDPIALLTRSMNLYS